MSHVTYRIVEHDGGWAYTVDGSYSETFPNHDAALKAASDFAVLDQEPRHVLIQDDVGEWDETVIQPPGRH